MSIKNQKGQMTIEMVLILVVLITMSYFVLKKFDEEIEPVTNFVVAPWVTVKGMMESGIWLEADAARAEHPNQWDKMRTVEGENP